MQNLDLSQLWTLAQAYIPKVLLAILVLIVGLWIIGRIIRLCRKLMKHRNIDDSLQPFFTSIIDVGLKVLLLLSVAQIFGIQTTSFVAVIGAAAFAIGFALQGSLANFASGVMILLFKPYKVGDLVEMQGHEGVVDEIQMFNTVLKTLDNKKIILPNSLATSGAIENITAYDLRRVDMVFGIGYDDDIDKAKTIIEQTIKTCPQILSDPAADIFVSELGDSSVNFVVRPWCKTEDYWTVHFYCHEEVKKQFDKAKIGIPYPQMDVHLIGSQ